MKVALLGAGLLGSAIAERLIDVGHDLSIYNRTLSKAEPLKKKKAALFSNPQDALKEAECVIFVLADIRSIEEVLHKIDPSAMEGKTFIQMGTIGPAESIELQKKIFELGAEYFECPVLGSRREAKEGTLILMVGSTPQKFAKWQDFLKGLGPNPRLIGEVGKAAALKLALNHFIAYHAVCFSLSLAIIEKNNVSKDDFMEILRQSALYSPMFDRKLPLWQSRQYTNANFPTQHLLKDVELIIKEAQDKGLSLEVDQAIAKVLRQTIKKGFGLSDYTSVLEEMMDPSK